MQPRLLLLVVFAALDPAALAQEDPPVAPPASPAPTADPGTEFQAGLCWVGRGDSSSLQYAKQQGASWISATPFAYGQQSFDQPPPQGYRFSRFRGENVEGIRELLRAAHRAGLKVLLKPHIWFSRDGKWRGDISMTTEEHWEQWFAAYEAYLDPFVAMATEEKAAAFCIGTELGGTIHREAQWRELITRIRARYDGALCFAANWYEEYRNVPFWDAVDMIGVQAYFPLTDDPDPTLEALVAGWQPWIEQLREVSAREDRPVLFTEFGYKPKRATAIKPWEWSSSAPPDESAQATAFQAAFDALADQPWLCGIHLWKWYSGYSGEGRPIRRRAHDNFSPQGLSGEKVFFEGVRRLRARSGPAAGANVQERTRRMLEDRERKEKEADRKDDGQDETPDEEPESASS